MRTVCPWEKLAYIPRMWCVGIRGLSWFDKQTRKASDQQLFLTYNQTAVRTCGGRGPEGHHGAWISQTHR